MSTQSLRITDAIARAADRYHLEVLDDVKPAQRFLSERLIDFEKNGFLQATNVAHIIQRGCSALTDATIPDCAAEVRESQFNFDVREHLRLLSAALSGEGDAPQIATDALTAGTVEAYYATCKPELYDLFSHLRVSELMCLDGDSLLIHALSHPHVDGEHIQTLHVAFIVLALLGDLIQRGATVHVLFFDSGEWMWSAAPQKRLARNLIRDLLLTRSQQDGCPFVCVQLPSFWGRGCAAHFDAHRPEVLAMSDGETLQRPTQEMEPYSSAPFRSVVADERLGEHAAAYFHTMMLWSVVRRVHAVFMPFERPHHNDTLAFTVRANGSRVGAYELVLADAVNLIRRRIADVGLTPLELPEMEQAKEVAILSHARSNR